MSGQNSQERAIDADLTIQANEVLLVVQSYLWHLQGANADAAEAEIFKAIRSALAAAYEAGRKGSA